MTNLNKLIERWQREVRKKYQTREAEVRLGYFVDYIDISYEDLDTITTQTATEAYRQALLDVLAGLGIDRFGSWNEHKDYMRAQIEELLAEVVSNN
jgi:hypothetical protein